MTVQQIGRLFRDANPSLTSRSLAVACAQGKLTEVRICMDKKLRTQRCGNEVRNSCGNKPVHIPRLT